MRPDYAHRKSIVLDLAYEEYCQRLEAGLVGKVQVVAGCPTKQPR